MKNKSHPLKNFLILWSTQSVSQLGSSITTFALTLWLYETTGSSLSTAALAICSYAPYVLMSIFAGTLTDRLDKKKTMLVCDLFAVLCTIAVTHSLSTRLGNRHDRIGRLRFRFFLRDLDTKEIGHFLDRLVRQFCGLTAFEHGNGRLLTTKETGKGGLVQPLRLARLLEQETDFCREIRHGG